MKNDAIIKENLYEDLILDVFIPSNSKNAFKNMEREQSEIPQFENIKKDLPKPILEGREDIIEMYYKAWEIAFKNLRKCDDFFIKNYIDTAFNDYIFLWDSAFMTLFGKYANHIFNFQQTLDNFYFSQEIDGFIGREISKKTGKCRYHRYDPVSTGGNLFAWVEMEYFNQVRDMERLKNVFPVILAYHRWLKMNRTWKDGTYWSTGWGSGMDNQMRVSKEVYDYSFHDHLTWIDVCLQQVLSCKKLAEMHIILNSKEDISDILEEKENLSRAINEKLWDDETSFFYDAKRDGSLVESKSIGAYWALLTDICDDDKRQKLIEKLSDENEFMTENPIPTMPKSNANFSEDGEYWRGGVWSPMNYMVLKGLGNKSSDLAFKIANKHIDHIAKVYKNTGTLWENYCPNKVSEGIPAKPNFVGWTGLSPISIFIEYVLGIKIDMEQSKIIWNINLLETHGIENLYFNGKKVSLYCEKRENLSDKPIVSVKGILVSEITVMWNDMEINIEHLN